MDLARQMLENFVGDSDSSDEEVEDNEVNLLEVVARNPEVLFGDEEEEDGPINQELDRIVPLLEREERTCIKDYVRDVVAFYSEAEFVRHFRFGRNLARDLVQRFSRTEAFQRLNGLAPDTIRDPTQAQKNRTKQHYQTKNNFPGVIGAIDGSHIRIDKPSVDQDAYYNRKKYFSIHVQAIVNEKSEFLDVFIGYTGCVHDARFFANSPVAQVLPNLCQAGEYILGDAAYPCLPFLITPYRDNGHLTQAQKYFNRTHISCRMMVEHAFGILKQRFRQLYFLRLRDMRRMVTLIHACCVLHNMANHEDLQYLEGPEEDDYPDQGARHMNAGNGAANIPAADGDEDPDDSVPGRQLRDELCRQIVAAQAAQTPRQRLMPRAESLCLP